MFIHNLIYTTNPSNWLQLITILVSIISIWFSHYLGTRKDKKMAEIEKEKKIYEIKNQKYNDLYIPFYRLLSKWQPDFTFSQAFIDDNKYKELNDVLDKNLQYLSTDISTLYLSYLSDLNIFEKCRDTLDDDLIFITFNNVHKSFNDLVESLLVEGSKLAKELNLANLSQPFFDILSIPDHQKHQLYETKEK